MSRLISGIQGDSTFSLLLLPFGMYFMVKADINIIWVHGTVLLLGLEFLALLKSTLLSSLGRLVPGCVITGGVQIVAMLPVMSTSGISGTPCSRSGSTCV